MPALKSTVGKTVKKRLGGGSRSRKKICEKNNGGNRKRRRVIPSEQTAQRSRTDFFTKVKNDFYFNTE